jgi:ATP-dependent Lon protease
LGVQRYKHAKAEEQNEIGTTCGLAWTQAGGELLVTEVNIMKGTGKLQLTGKLGDVMKESAQAALSYVRTNANRLGIFSSVFEKTDIHIHVPAGAVPKDGPSAGVTIATSLVSAFTSIPVRNEVAMTGETTLRGKVLAIGGLKEKLLAAKRGVISTVIIPDKNKKDLSEIPEEIQNGLEIIPVNTVEEVLNISLERFPSPVIDPVSEDEEGSNKESPGATILPETESSDSPRTYDA